MARPRQFDREEALHAALKIFWSKGYEGATFSQLEKAMGLSRSSLVASFKDKQTLFDEALAYYMRNYVEPRSEILRRSEQVRRGLRDYYGALIDSNLHSDNPSGCFLVNATVAAEGSDSKLKAFLETRAASREKDILNLLKRGQAAGEIAPDKDIHALARTFVTFAYGISSLSRVVRSRRHFETAVDQILALLD